MDSKEKGSARDRENQTGEAPWTREEFHRVFRKNNESVLCSGKTEARCSARIQQLAGQGDIIRSLVYISASFGPYKGSSSAHPQTATCL